jgi:hypothetical protein
MFGRGICEKYQSRDEKFPEPNGEGNIVSRLVFWEGYLRKIPVKNVISCVFYVTSFGRIKQIHLENDKQKVLFI